MRICFVGDPRSVHTQRWVEWFARTHPVALVRTASSPALPEIPGPTLPDGPSGPRGFRLVRWTSRLRDFLGAWSPDLLHAHYLNESGWLGAASRFRPLVVTAWGSDVYQAPHASRMARVLNPWCVRQADHVTCDSEDLSRQVVAWGVPAHRVTTVGWGVEVERFRPGAGGGEWRRRLGIPPEVSVLLSPRQWLPNSHIREMVEAFSLMDSRTHLILKRLPAFEGEYAREVEGMVAASPAGERIHMVAEEIPEGELPGLYGCADAVVSLCGTDGTPVSVLEAMATGLPVVALDVESLREWITPGGGVLLAAPEPVTIARAVEGFLESPEAMDKAAHTNRAIILERASRAREMARVEALYEALVSVRSGEAL
ncbi:MAG: glycosyltransferase family 4 protein [Gemmatimonadota bacterium]